MEYILSFLFVLTIANCGQQKYKQEVKNEPIQLSYENKVYEFLNSIYRHKETSPYNENVYINTNHNLNNSFQNTNKVLLVKLLQEAGSNRRFAISKKALNLNNWAREETNFVSSSFDQKRINLSHLIFKDPRNIVSMQTFNRAKIDGILFLDDFAVLNYPLLDGHVKHLTLFKKENVQYIRINMVTDPAMGTE
ncbi:hypothetical protein AAU57_02065 [Nonlabens sp. YIK11]|nr:hypothetical protein AAU57_02065 [Nonlabens sp. YIK11]